LLALNTKKQKKQKTKKHHKHNSFYIFCLYFDTRSLDLSEKKLKSKPRVLYKVPHNQSTKNEEKHANHG